MFYTFLLQQNLSPGEAAWKTILEMTQSFWARVPYIFVGIVLFFIFLLVSRITKGTIRKTSERTRLDPMLAELFARLSSMAIIIFGLSAAAMVIIPTFKPSDLITGLGITSVALGFALKEVLQNFFAGILILWRRPFVVGDQIRVKDFEGTVEEINIRATRIKTYNGERVVVPNSELFLNEVVVRTAFDSRRVRFTVGIAYPESIEKARDVIQSVLEKTEGVLPEPAPSVHVVELGDFSVNFSVLFWALPQQNNVRLVSDRVITNIKLALDEADIEIPYPHSVVFLHDKSGEYNLRVKNALPTQSNTDAPALYAVGEKTA